MSALEGISFDGTLPNAPDPRAHDHLTSHKDARMLIAHSFQTSRFPHAWLVSGQLGIGKATLAWHFARQLVEFGKIDESLILSREILNRYGQENHPNVLTISRPSDEKNGFKAQIPIEAIRNLAEKLQFASTEGGFRAVIIDPVDAMNTASSNALLKMLEEPPQRVVFFLISHAPNLLLPTIKSRCQSLRLQNLSIKDMQAIWPKLTPEPIPAEEDFALADGSMRAALQFDGEFSALYSEAFHLLSKAPHIPHEAMISFASKLSKGNRMETIDLAKNIFGLLIARLVRAATHPETYRETELAKRIAPLPLLAKWAELSAMTAEALNTAGKLNLDPEITIFQRWLAIEEMLKSFRG